MNPYELAVETLDLFFDISKAKLLPLSDGYTIADQLKKKGADRIDERVQALDFAFGLGENPPVSGQEIE